MPTQLFSHPSCFNNGIYYYGNKKQTKTKIDTRMWTIAINNMTDVLRKTVEIIRMLVLPTPNIKYLEINGLLCDRLQYKSTETSAFTVSE